MLFHILPGLVIMLCKERGKNEASQHQRRLPDRISSKVLHYCGGTFCVGHLSLIRETLGYTMSDRWYYHGKEITSKIYIDYFSIRHIQQSKSCKHDVGLQRDHNDQEHQRHEDDIEFEVCFSTE